MESSPAEVSAIAYPIARGVGLGEGVGFGVGDGLGVGDDVGLGLGVGDGEDVPCSKQYNLARVSQFLNDRLKLAVHSGFVLPLYPPYPVCEEELRVQLLHV